MPEDFADIDVELPAMTTTVQRRQTGGADIMLVLVTMGLAPFVQAVVGSFGGKVADAIDSRARRAVRRLLHRVYQEPELPHRPDRVRMSVSLTDSDTGTRVLLDANLPAEAVAQLVRLTVAGPAAGGGTVLWHPEGAEDGRWYVESEGRFTAAWDRDTRSWQPA